MRSFELVFCHSCGQVVIMNMEVAMREESLHDPAGIIWFTLVNARFA
jgi:hypothetical protein